MTSAAYGGRAKCAQRLIRLEMPIPTTVALSFLAVHDIAMGNAIDPGLVLPHFDQSPLLSVRPSSGSPDWGGPGAILNIGMNDKKFNDLCETLGETPASILYLRFINSYATHVARLDSDAFEDPESPTTKDVESALEVYKDQATEPFPQDVNEQLVNVLRSMARAWEGTSARLLRQAKGAPGDAGLGLVVQAMAIGVGRGECGSGVIQFASSDTGWPEIHGRYLRQSQGRESLDRQLGSLYLSKDPRGPSLEETCPAVFAQLLAHSLLARQRLREEMQIEFTVENGELRILDAVRIVRSSRAAVRIAVDLANDGVISSEEALMRVDPKALSELLHRQVAPNAPRTVLAKGISASPGAATGKIVFTASAAQACAARDEAAVLVRRETGPEDIRGMHAAVAVMTERGGVTSHAAVIGRGLGLPCVVGASDMSIDGQNCTVIGRGNQILREGDIITVDGTSGEVLVGHVETVEAGLDDAVTVLLTWADELRDIGIRANADTPRDAQTAKNFHADGIGLCRSEHMFFEADRLSVMREMIFSENEADRATSLERLLPMQRADFTKLFQIMEGKPVCIRLLDPPLHEFLPADRIGLRDLAETLNLPLSKVTERVAQMSEYNPMLGLRGVRLGITVPEIYDMQARAIFEAAIDSGVDVEPEIMIPLVSACREVELVKTRIDATAAAVRVERGKSFNYSLGVMVETPRAALRAGEIAKHSQFLSFGTNDLTQMTYGLSRDDAGRFMSSYVQQGVYEEDPFHRIDTEGVGELLTLGAERGRAARPEIILSICGEHGGDPEAISFFRKCGFTYVSCSPFRVPVARLAAAQCAIIDINS
ncbi:pyruvate, phosphate dikinase [Planktomarina sp.]|nr:putative PEP-binding protein [Planktomarina sp.]MDA9099752.1 pyruvate, phosphate dikinase [Planktomarina sp.]